MKTSKRSEFYIACELPTVLLFEISESCDERFNRRPTTSPNHNLTYFYLLSDRWRCFYTTSLEKAGNRPIKLNGCCVHAKRNGFHYVWIDTFCIDKASSTELSEAINSIFRWYQNSAVCYVYLSDVPAVEDIRDPKSRFFSSRWFRRGWTLQELLAPKELHFYSSEWSYLETKNEFAAVVEIITGISRRFLHVVIELSDASVAEWMAWAAK